MFACKMSKSSIEFRCNIFWPRRKFSVCNIVLHGSKCGYHMLACLLFCSPAYSTHWLTRSTQSRLIWFPLYETNFFLHNWCVYTLWRLIVRQQKTSPNYTCGKKVQCQTVDTYTVESRANSHFSIWILTLNKHTVLTLYPKIRALYS